MAYFIGKDVKVWVCTEHEVYGVTTGNAGAGFKLAPFDSTSGSPSSPALANATNQIYAMGVGLGYAGFNVADITGVDLAIGAMDEDIAFFGTKTPGKIETKQDMNITVTRKKSDRLWSTMAQGTSTAGTSYGDGKHGARWGLIIASGSTTASDMRIADGTIDPKSSTDEDGDVCYGFRIAIQLKGSTSDTGSDGDVVILRNCSMGEYTTTLSADSADEESSQFVTMVKPLILHGDIASNLFEGGTTQTPAVDM
jgi:hypothetical protein